MTRFLVLPLLIVAVAPLAAQEEQRSQPTPPRYATIPHLFSINGRDNPAAIPLHVSVLTMLLGRFGADYGPPPAAERFAQAYAVDIATAQAMVTAIRQLRADLEAQRYAQTKELCTRTFRNAEEWLGAMVAFDAESVSARVAALDKLRAVVGRDAWERVLLSAYKAARSVSMAIDDYAGIAADIGYETAFANQCKSFAAK